MSMQVARLFLPISLAVFVTVPAFTQLNIRAGDQGSYPKVVHPRIAGGGHEFRIVQLAENMEFPWSLAFLPDGGLLVSERPGRLQLLSPNGSRNTISGLPEVRSAGQGGLLDIALHPDFINNRLVYWTYAASGPGGASTALARGRLDGFALTEVRTLWTMQKRSGSGVHFRSEERRVG